MQHITRNCVEPSLYEHQKCHQKQKLLPHHYDQWKLWETTSTKQHRMFSSSSLVDNSQVDWRHECHMMAPLKKIRTAYKNKNKKVRQQQWGAGAQICNKSQSDLLEYHCAVNVPVGCHHLHIDSM